MKVVFQSPESALDKNGNKIWPNGFNSKNKFDFDLIPNTPGVYIIGVKVNVNGKDTFCPLYVGIREILQHRIKAHHKDGGYLNGKKELFDLTQNIKSVYDDIHLWNTLWGQLRNTQKNDITKLNLFNTVKHLIWFNSKLFFSNKLTFPRIDILFEDNKHNHRFTTNIDLPNLLLKNLHNAVSINNFSNQINDTKEIITNQYYFAFYEYDNPFTSYNQIKSQLEQIESAVKWILESQFSIYTYGHTSGPGKTLYNNLKKGNYKQSLGINIDISSLQNLLYNPKQTTNYLFAI